MNEEELRKEAVRRRRLGENPETIAGVLGRTSQWVRKWVALPQLTHELTHVPGQLTGVDWHGSRLPA